MRKHLRLISLVLLIFLFGGMLFPFNAARAQQDGQVEITAVNSESFPTLRVQFEVYDSSGAFLTGLQPEDVLIYENDQPTTVGNLQLLRPGVQFSVAVNLGSDLSTRYAGSTRFEYIRQRLLGWAESQPEDSTDQLSLATNSGLQLIRSRDRQDWVSAISDLEQIDLFQERPNLTALTRAIDLVTDPSPEETMKRAVLFITPLIPAANLEPVNNLADRAARQGAPVHIWLVSSNSAVNAQPELVDPLRNLAESTGGQIFFFSGAEELPDPEAYLNSRRYAFRAQYDSRINSSATHSLAVEVRNGSNSLRSANRPLFLSILAPNPIFLSPQTNILRTWDSSLDPANPRLTPSAVEIRIVIEYPDGYPRPLASSRLYVDEVLVHENTVEPFDTFAWDISSLTSDGRHSMQVEVEDQLGLSKSSIEIPVMITTEVVESNRLKTFLSGDRPLIFGSILAAGLLLLATLGLARFVLQRGARLRDAQARDPVTQPVIPQKDRRKPAKRLLPIERPTWPRHATAGLSSAPAWLIRVPSEENSRVVAGELVNRSASSAIPLTRRETTLGSDPLRAGTCIDSPSVSGLHARIVQSGEGEYQIFDNESVAGTWVNYTPVAAQGVTLRHGDLIQLGRVSLRFELANPPELTLPRVRPYQDQP